MSAKPTAVEQSAQPDPVTVDDLQTRILENNVQRCQLSDLLVAAHRVKGRELNAVASADNRNDA
jgi:hypothetical protein